MDYIGTGKVVETPAGPGIYRGRIILHGKQQAIVELTGRKTGEGQPLMARFEMEQIHATGKPEER